MSYFYSFGGWTLHETDSVADAAAKAAVEMAESLRQRARVVEVEIWDPVRGRTEYVTGYTFDKRIPPHRKEVRDVDCKITVTHHLDIRQGHEGRL